ncbi:TPA: hypothetical protein DIC20_04865 [Candidatus Dependentiae bacterium]|nr:hypothetical protein [Candidatus Dependentiae bacterium]HCU01006.1 hypothetical protein [Candidatus Dependentiae bacterium]
MTLMVADMIEKAQEIAFQKKVRPEVLESLLFETDSEPAEELKDLESPCTTSYSPDLSDILERRSLESIEGLEEHGRPTSPGAVEISRISERHVGPQKSGPHAYVRSILPILRRDRSGSLSYGTGKKPFMTKPLTPSPVSGSRGLCLWCHKKVSAQDLNSHMRKFHKDQEKRLAKRK